MKTKSTLLMLIVAGSGALLTSCVVDTYPSHSTTVVEPAYRPGYTINTLPSGYRAEVIGGTRYYYHNNVYYRPQGRSYVVVDSPHRHVPRHDHDRDHDWDGRRDRDRDWDRRGPGPGRDRNVTVIRELPNGYTVVNHRGQRYYRAGDRYYQSSGGGYIIVGSPF
jgi:hypothetical protein